MKRKRDNIRKFLKQCEADRKYQPRSGPALAAFFEHQKQRAEQFKPIFEALIGSRTEMIREYLKNKI